MRRNRLCAVRLVPFRACVVRPVSQVSSSLSSGVYGRCLAMRWRCVKRWNREPIPGEPIPGEPVPGEPVPGEPGIPRMRT